MLQNRQQMEKRGSQESSLRKDAFYGAAAGIGSAALGAAAKILPWATKAAPAVNNAMRMAPGAASIAGKAAPVVSKAAPVANTAANSVAMPARMVGNTVAGISKGVVKAKNQAANAMAPNVNPMWRELVRRPVTTATNMHGATRFPNARVIPQLQPVGQGSGLGGHHIIASPTPTSTPNLWDKVKDVGGRIWKNETFQNTMNTGGLGLAADMGGTYLTGEDNNGTFSTLGVAAGLLPAVLRRLPGGAALGNTIGKGLTTINSNPYAQKAIGYSSGLNILGGIQQRLTGHDYITNPIGSAEEALQEKMHNTAVELGFQSPEHMQAALGRMSRVARIFTPAPQPPQADPLF